MFGDANERREILCFHRGANERRRISSCGFARDFETVIRVASMTAREIFETVIRVASMIAREILRRLFASRI